MPDATNILPRDWTQNVDSMGGDAEWGPDGMSSETIKEFGLADPRPVLGSTTSSGNAMFYFTSGGKIYLFNAMDGSLYTVKKPETTEALIELFVQGKQKEVEVERFEGQ
ncbi:hypothetical protein F53441_12529 [Fusarium austroafricanum]|uniref:Uncharacterized protein n=1 Tax=Fusarium austroafricanum TaxID=2364996 RepID=A0A8H4JYQ3_9HYPO|nr:hypothetical protein F53441_12529 [Fusarium austroafricanum]